MLGILILEDESDCNHSSFFTSDSSDITSVVIPVVVFFLSKPTPAIERSLLGEQDKEADQSEQNWDGYGSDIILSEFEDGKPAEMESLPAVERLKRMAQLQDKLFQAAAEGAERRGFHPSAGINQICESLGYTVSSIFVSMINIWNFLGRVGGGYLPEIVIRKFSYPRPVAMAVFQFIMALGFLYPGEIYILSIVIGIGYGAHWSIMPASISELFGLKSCFTTFSVIDTYPLRDVR